MISEIANMSLPAMVDLPTPPLAEEIAMTFRTSFIGRFSGKPRCLLGRNWGGALERGSPYAL